MQMIASLFNFIYQAVTSLRGLLFLPFPLLVRAVGANSFARTSKMKNIETYVTFARGHCVKCFTNPGRLYLRTITDLRSGNYDLTQTDRGIDPNVGVRR